MTDPEEVWNLLHDGAITAISTAATGSMLIRVEIQYLRDLFSPPGEGFEVLLENCHALAYQQWGSTTLEHAPHALASLEPEILSASTAEDGAVIVVCTGGTLRFQYEGVSLKLDTGSPITLQQLQEAARMYWNRFASSKPR